VTEEVTIEQGVAARIARGSTTFGCGHAVTVENSLWKTKAPKWVLGCRTCNANRLRNRYHDQRAQGLNPSQTKECRFGHPYPPGLQVQPGHKARRCPTCVKIRNALKTERERNRSVVTRPQVKGRCRTCGRPFDKVFPGTQRPYCSHCQSNRTAEWNRRKRLNMPTRVHVIPAGISQDLDALIAHYSLPPDEDGCILWDGPTRSGTPAIDWYDKEARRTRRKNVRPYLWEKLHGPIPNGYRAAPGCTKRRCITPECLELVRYVDQVLSEDAVGRAKMTRQLRTLRGRDRYVTPALALIPKVRLMLKHRFQNLYSSHEDIIQEVLLRLYLAWTKKRTVIQDLDKAIGTIALRVAIDWGRRKYLRMEKPLIIDSYDNDDELVELDPPAPAIADPLNWFQEAEREYVRRQYLLTRLKLVPPKARKAIRLQLLEGLSQQEIAAAMRVSENTVEQHLTKARRLMLAPQTRISQRRVV
jgi:RNA polymerase sigma factor (sigma-70 family)